MIYRDAQLTDLENIVAIYNSTIESRMVTADTTPVTVEERLQWFHEHNSTTRPLWMVEDGGKVIGWASFNNFYGRPAYNGTSEISIYLSEGNRGKGYGQKILSNCIQQAPALQIHTLLGFIFSHNVPSIQMLKNAGFEEWALLKEVAKMDGQYFSLIIMGFKTNVDALLPPKK
jgi:phosphinothricin acetyltransferase